MADDGRPQEVAEAWDEGLAPARTELAWGRTGLAVLVAVAALSRRVWTLHGGLEIAALTLVGVGGLVWLFGMRLSRGLHDHMDPHGLDGRRAFGLVTLGTVLLAVGGLVLGIVLPR